LPAVITIPVRMPDPAASGYDVLIGRGALDTLPRVLVAAAPAAYYALIVDSNVAALHGERVLSGVRATGTRADAFTFPAGEASKSVAEWSRLTELLLGAGAGRDACVIALGGGVCCDLAGFVAATCLRGIPCVHLPTSLLAMVDASVGGKTGIDTPQGKNLVGAFHPPRVVVADPDVLSTLPEPELREGLAEALKHGAIADAVYLEETVRDIDSIVTHRSAALDRLVVRSVEIKAAIVAADPFERGVRATLNFGHTIAHGLERLTGYRMKHGHAVAVGMVVEAAIGEAIGVTAPGTADAIREAVIRAGLPSSVPAGTDAAALIEATASDKKARSARVRYALLARAGVSAQDPSGGWTFEVPPDPATRVLARLTA
jgi:3-dehydroquinate synthase